MTKAALAGLVAACAGCSSAGVAGGALVAPGTEPAGTTLALYGIGRCEDERGARIPEPEARVSAVRLSDGRVVLVDRRPGYDSIVVDNGWDDGNDRVFQLALKRSGGTPSLREYRLPLSGSHFGRLVVVDRVSRWNDSRRGFHADYARAALSCSLSPLMSGG